MQRLDRHGGVDIYLTDGETDSDFLFRNWNQVTRLVPADGKEAGYSYVAMPMQANDTRGRNHWSGLLSDFCHKLNST